MAKTDYSAFAVDQNLRNGAGLSLLDYIAPRIAPGVPPPIGDGLTHPLSGFYTTLGAALVDYPFLAATWHGAAWGDVELFNVALQAAINDAKCGELLIPRGIYQANVYIDIANRQRGGFTLKGIKNQSLTNNAYTGIVGNTGGVLFDLSGSEFITLKDLLIQPGTSTIGILMARTTDTADFASQFNHFENLNVSMSHIPGANGGVGTFGIYNFASELLRHYNVFINADNPYFAALVNPAPYYARRGDSNAAYFWAQSPNPAVHVGGTLTPLVQAFGSLGNLSFEGQCCFTTYMQPCLALNGVSSFHAPNMYFRNNTGVFGRYSTTIAANVATGSRTVTPADMTPGSGAIIAGSVLTVSNADGSNSEVVFVTAITSTTFTATFASTKTGPGIIVQMGDPSLAAVNLGRYAGGGMLITGLAEEFDQVLITRGISNDLNFAVSRGHTTTAIPSVQFDAASGAAVPGISGGSITAAQGDATHTSIFGGDPAVLFCDVTLGASQFIDFGASTPSFGDLRIRASEWSPVINAGTLTYDYSSLGRRKPTAPAVSPPAQYGELVVNGGVTAHSDRMVTSASNTTPIVMTVEGTGHNLSNAQQILSFGIRGNTAASGTYYVKTATYGANEFALYSDALLTLPVAGNGDYAGAGVVRALGETFYGLADQGTNYFRLKLAADHSLQLTDIANAKTLLNLLNTTMGLGAAGVLVLIGEHFQTLGNATVNGNASLAATVNLGALAGGGSRGLQVDNLGNIVAAGTTLAAVATDLAALKAAYNAHKHGGVTVGAGTSGGTDTPA